MSLTEIRVSCPACDHAWLAALNDPAAWWGLPEATAARTVAKQCYCRRCEHAPPMNVTEAQPTTPLLWDLNETEPL